jgi:hypothetical protein
MQSSCKGVAGCTKREGTGPEYYLEVGRCPWSPRGENRVQEAKDGTGSKGGGEFRDIRIERGELNDCGSKEPYSGSAREFWRARSGQIII